MPFQTEAQFLASQARPLGPEKHVHIDSAEAPVPTAQRTAGEMYGGDRLNVLALEPRLCCPNCDTPVAELGNGTEAYKFPKIEGLDNVPLGTRTAEQPPITFTLHPCGCKVNSIWVAAFNKEINSRRAGVPAMPLVVPQADIDARKAKLEASISDLMNAQAHAETDAIKTALHCRLIAATDELMRLVPGRHNKPPELTIDSTALSWAIKNNLHTPTHAPLAASIRGATRDAGGWGQAAMDFIRRAGAPANAGQVMGIAADGTVLSMTTDGKFQPLQPQPGPSAGDSQRARDLLAAAQLMAAATDPDYGPDYPRPRGLGGGLGPAEVPRPWRPQAGRQRQSRDENFFREVMNEFTYGRARDAIKLADDVKNICLQAKACVEQGAMAQMTDGYRLRERIYSELLRLGEKRPTLVRLVAAHVCHQGDMGHPSASQSWVGVMQNIQANVAGDGNLFPAAIRFLACLPEFVDRHGGETEERLAARFPPRADRPVSGPLAQPAAEAPPSPATVDQFHQQFARKKRRILPRPEEPK